MEGQSSASRSSLFGRSGTRSFHGFMVSPNVQAQDSFLLWSKRKSDAPVSFIDGHSNTEAPKDSCEENISYAMGEHIDGNNECEKEKKESPWQRVKWTDQMVKLLITAVSYIGEDAAPDCSGGRRRPTLPKKGKWKAISKVMAERNFHVSPQQCEDKFNDLNKRYKKLNVILGRGTSCDVVENPALLDLMDIPDKAKESVRKILSSKQLFYREMCSYHNGNRLHIPPDQSVQSSLQSALRSGDDLEFHESKAYGSDVDEENDACDSQIDNTEETNALDKDLGPKSVLAKRKRPGENEYMDWGYILKIQSATKTHAPHGHARMDQVSGQSVDGDWQINNQIMYRSLQLEDQKVHIQAEMLELEKQRLRWLQFNELEDRELEKMRLENENLKIENERLALDIKCREMGRHAY